MTCRKLMSGVVLALAIPLSAWAQESNEGWGGRGFLTFNLGVQTASPGFAYASAVPFWGDTAKARLDIPGKPGAAFDIGGGVRMVQNLGAAVIYSRYSKERAATLTTTIPNPLQLYGFGSPATTERHLPLQREEDAVHFQAMYRIPIAGKIQVGLFGGPTFFRCLDDVISSFTLEGELLGYTLQSLNWTVDFKRLTQTVEKDTSWGYNTGVDLTYLIAKHVGVGTTVRYSEASHHAVNRLANPNTEELDMNGAWIAGDVVDTTTMKHGGLQWNGGVSFRF